MNYQKQANDFAKKHGIKLQIIGSRYGNMWEDNKRRHIFKCELSRKKKSYTFEFGQSIADGSKVPNMYNVLSCLQKYDVGTFQNFCNEYGFDPNEPASKKTYKDTVKEFEAVECLFGDIMDELREIQ